MPETVDRPVGSSLIQNAVDTAKTVALAAAAAAAAVALSRIDSPNSTRTALNALAGQNLSFPEDLINSSVGRNFYLSLTFKEYQRRSIFNQPFLREGDSIRLPIPNNLTDTQSVIYEQADAPIVGAGIEQTLNSVQTGGSGLAAATREAFTTLGAGAYGAGLGTLATQAQKNNIPFDQFLQMSGKALNPFLTVLFKQPTFKTHTFSWRLSPANERESNNLKKIIEVIRANMLPGMAPSQGGTLLGYPNMVQINLFAGYGDTYLYKFKPAVVEQMSVNFSPGSTPGFFKGTNAPTEVLLSLQIKEIEYWLSEDVTSGGYDRASAVFLGG